VVPVGGECLESYWAQVRIWEMGGIDARSGPDCLGMSGNLTLLTNIFPWDPPETSPGGLNGVLENGPDCLSYIAVCWSWLLVADVGS
jgi:hypothetical protein